MFLVISVMHAVKSHLQPAVSGISSSGSYCFIAVVRESSAKQWFGKDSAYRESHCVLQVSSSQGK